MGANVTYISQLSFWVLVTEGLFHIFTSSAIILCERARESRRTILSEGAVLIRLVTPLPAQAQLKPQCILVGNTLHLKHFLTFKKGAEVMSTSEVTKEQ